MKKNAIRTTIVTLVLALLLTATLGGCGRKDSAATTAEPTPTDVPVSTTASTPTAAPVSTDAPAPTASSVSTDAPASTDVPVSTDEPAPTDAPVSTAAPAETPAAAVERRDGERFEETILLEGMEETVQYEHVKNDTIGVELDYDYELFVRYSEADRECFVSAYDQPDAPENYLELTYRAEDAETVSAIVSSALSNEYDIIREIFRLDRAGSCIRIDASNVRDNGGAPDLLQMVYIIPAADGCRVATAHYTFESAEGFGRRFAYMMNTLAVIDRIEEAWPAGTWQTASIGFADDGTMAPEYYVQFTDAEIVYGHMQDGEFVFDHADSIVSLGEGPAGGYRIQAESSGGVQYTYQTCEGDDTILEYYETWDEDAFPEMYRGGASLSRCF